MPPAARTVACFVSPHGFGHAARACAVLAEMHRRDPTLRFELFTTVPEWFFAESLAAPFAYHTEEADVGLAQRTALVEDLDATLLRLAGFLPFPQARLDRLAGELRSLGCAMVVCDVSPLGLAAAARAGIAAALVENFTWDWIYASYLAARPAFRPHVDALAAIFAAAQIRIQTAPACAPDPRFAAVEPVSRPPRTAPEEVRERLGVRAGEPLVLLTMGGVRWQHAALDDLAAQRRFAFVVPGAAEQAERRGGLIALPHRSGFHHPDLVRAADAVIGKLGYSTLAEAHAAGVPFGFVARPGFRESAVLADFAARTLPAVAVDAAELASGAYLARIPALLELPRPSRPRPNGAGEAARILLDAMQREPGIA
ncbi:MAG TPA: hypothetical protein VLW17_04730 [Thermoanaerobaculaceae bacterium]|nr:hypothetical protein [Thermoanaerobaculaceae bacterium]